MKKKYRVRSIPWIAMSNVNLDSCFLIGVRLHMPQAQIEYELGKLFPQIEIPFDDFIMHLIEPNVIKIQKVLKYLNNMLNWAIEYDVGFHDVEVNVEGAGLVVEPWGTIKIKKSTSPLTRFEIEIFNEYDEKEPIFIHFLHYFGDLAQEISIAFLGKVELEAYDDNTTIRIRPESKVYVFSSYYDVDYFSYLKHFLQES